MTTYTFSNFPIAIPAFGGYFRRNDFENFQDYTKKLKGMVDSICNVPEKHLTNVKYATSIAQIAGKFAPVFSVLVALIGEVDQLYKELKKVEQKILNIILDGKLKALETNLKNLESRHTSDMQMVAEIVNAISNLNEILPVFANKDSIFRERFYEGAPLFVRLCVILKAISVIAENTSDYNNSNLPSLKKEYQEVLDWYRNKCIGSRMASCYVKGMLTIDGVSNWTSDWDRHYNKYKKHKYYEESTSFPWIKYGQNLGGGGWRLWCGYVTYCKLIDPWDNRSHEEVKFERMDIENTSDSLLPNGDVKYHQDVLAEYRRRVEEVMLKFFDDAALIDPTKSY